MILFSDRAVFAHDLTRNRNWSLQAIDQYKARGGTALYDAVYDSLQRLRGIEGRRVVVVLTDGKDEDNSGRAAGSTDGPDAIREGGRRDRRHGASGASGGGRSSELPRTDRRGGCVD